MGTLPQALEIIFEMQRKMSNEKITRRKINFQLTKHDFFPSFFSLFGPLLFSHLIIFLSLIHFKQFKML
jgi:hypothetical protein